MRILAYAQLLQSYSSLTLDSLAHAFGVTVDFVDKYVICQASLNSFCFVSDGSLLQRIIAVYCLWTAARYH